MLKIINASIPPAAPTVSARIPERATVGLAAQFSAESDPEGVSALGYHWDFGDGTSFTGQTVSHTFTRSGTFAIHLIADGIEGSPFDKEFRVSVTGSFETRFDPTRIRRRAEDSH
jgi:PKD repeat protein